MQKNQIGEGNAKDNEQHGGQAMLRQSSKQFPDKDSLKMTNISNMNTQCIESETEDGRYNLHLYPRFIYFMKVEANGHMPHQQAVFNNKID